MDSMLQPECGFTVIRPIASAESDYLCDAQQAAVNQLPVLDAACPIGDGLWAKSPSGETLCFGSSVAC